jgi:molybdopterin molybdotransferase
MITSKKALEIILNHTKNFGVEEIPFIEATGRILKEAIVADRDFPPFNRVSMDGIAVVYDIFTSGRREFSIENMQAAGSEQVTLKHKENCIEAMTGAVLPKNTDAVIPYELVTIKDGKATVNLEEIKQLQNVHLQGKDRKVNDPLLKINTVISPAEIGVLATVGRVTVKVAKQPKVMIISTGDELVEVSENPLVHQIRRSNSYTLVALLENLHILADTVHITDDKPLLKQKIEQFLKDYDVLLFSGAVSKGKFDFIPEVLDELGVKKLFHRVKQRPGKPFWFGVKDALNISERGENNSFGLSGQNGDECHSERVKRSEPAGRQGRESHTVVFAFPGNPVSTFVGCVKYFYPWVKKTMGIGFENKQKAILSEDYFFKPALTYFLQVKLENNNGMLYATPITGNGSGDLANLADADAFLELPDDRNEFKKGEVFPLIKYR